MSLYSDPLQEILKSIKDTNNVTLVQGEYNYSDPAEVSIPNGNNAQFTISAKDQQSTYAGSVGVTVKRLPLSDLNSLITPKVRVYLPQTTLDIALAMNDAFGLNFSANDIAIYDLVELVDGAGVVTLQAAETSLNWIGSVDVAVEVGNIPLGDFLTTRNLNGIDYPAQISTRIFAKMYSYWRNFSAQQAALEQVQVGTGQLEILKGALTAITGDQWITATSGRWSLLNATVTYAGSTAGDDRFNQKYQKALVVALDQQSALGLAGDLIIHYNLPVVED